MSTPPSLTEIEQKAIDLIRPRHPRDKDFGVSRIIPDIGTGQIVIVDVIQNGQKVGENYAYVGDNFTAPKAFLSMDDLLEWSVSERRIQDNTHPSLLSRIFDLVNAAAIIALVITITICMIAWTSSSGGRPIEIPEVLSQALATILGFYFGSRVQKSVSQQEDQSTDASSSNNRATRS